MKIALLTCQNFPDLYPPDQFLIPALAQHQIEVVPAIWDDESVDWTTFDHLVFRNTWDYFEKETAFNNWLALIQKLDIPTLNASEIIQQNKHKFYLRDLEKQGIPIIKTVFIEQTSGLNLADIIPSHWKKAVIKPAFSGGSYQTEAFDVSDLDKINKQYQPIAAEKELLLQEFIPEIQSLGETSLIFFNKQFSHAINKKPTDRDFRVQVQFGGQYTAIQPNPALIHQAQKVVDTFGGKLLYARVDGIVIDNQLQLMEVECIEPDLYFDYSDGARERFVNAIVELIR
ncbi:ATP-grasp domain-containing protein [Flavobacterium sp.]|uniref:ATP-grasp domain-containing protein n=1 Tax=Flavobacterium sp. TaxID=239 RepID=UPI0039E41AE8